MITVRSLHIYPVKSCRRIDLEVADVVATGFQHDRQWMVVDDEGRFLSQRTHPALARVRTRLDGGRLTLSTDEGASVDVAVDGSAGGDRSVTVWNDRCNAVSAGPEAAAWVSSLLGARSELVRLSETAFRQVDTDYADHGDRVAFADGFPFLLISQASVDELNRRLADPVPANRFRANIVIDGCGPHAEDEWTEITIGGVGFRVAKPCARCRVIATDQLDGSRGAEPLRTLARYRDVGGKVLFGQNLVHSATGTIHVGDAVRPITRA